VYLHNAVPYRTNFPPAAQFFRNDLNRITFCSENMRRLCFALLMMFIVHVIVFWVLTVNSRR
jgi:hypothetical protein